LFGRHALAFIFEPKDFSVRQILFFGVVFSSALATSAVLVVALLVAVLFAVDPQAVNVNNKVSDNTYFIMSSLSR
jgi:hypothetical protein